MHPTPQSKHCALNHIGGGVGIYTSLPVQHASLQYTFYCIIIVKSHVSASIYYDSACVLEGGGDGLCST